jgi:hypothetical protein
MHRNGLYERSGFKGRFRVCAGTYNAAKAGKFNKTIAVYANTGEGVIQLTVKGEIIE